MRPEWWPSNELCSGLTVPSIPWHTCWIRSGLGVSCCPSVMSPAFYVIKSKSCMLRQPNVFSESQAWFLWIGFDLFMSHVFQIHEYYCWLSSTSASSSMMAFYVHKRMHSSTSKLTRNLSRQFCKDNGRKAPDCVFFGDWEDPKALWQEMLLNSKFPHGLNTFGLLCTLPVLWLPPPVMDISFRDIPKQPPFPRPSDQVSTLTCRDKSPWILLFHISSILKKSSQSSKLFCQESKDSLALEKLYFLI